MYHCNEILYYCYSSADEFTAAIARYPFKGGLVKEINLDEIQWVEKETEKRITLDRSCPLRDATWETVVFTHYAKVKVGAFPNGNSNFITLYRT
jgi:hypothetical protein